VWALGATRQAQGAASVRIGPLATSLPRSASIETPEAARALRWASLGRLGLRCFGLSSGIAAACCATKPSTAGRPAAGSRVARFAAASSATGPPPEWPPTARRVASTRPRSAAGSAACSAAPLRTKSIARAITSGVMTLVLASCTPSTSRPCEARWRSVGAYSYEIWYVPHAKMKTGSCGSGQSALLAIG
jgi:hypothetical protein